MKLGRAMLNSRKAQAALIALGVVLLGDRLGLTADQVADARNVFMAYIVGQGVADAGAAFVAAKASTS